MKKGSPNSGGGKSRVLLTGGAGFIGSSLLRKLLERNELVERVLTLDQLTYAGSLENLAPDSERHHFIKGDIRDGELVSRLLEEERIDAVFHLAAETHVDRSIDDASVFVQSNVEGTQVLLEAARRWWKESGDENFRFLYVSTDEVYGSLSPNEEPKKEDALFAPNSPYAASKAAGDHFVRAWRNTYGLPTLTVRPGNTFGPRQFPEKLIPLAFTKAMSGDKIPLYGDGTQRRDWLAVEDLCDAIVRVYANGEVGAAYNVSAGNEMTNLEVVRALLEAMAEQTGRSRDELDSLIEFVEDRPGHDRRYALDSSKIRDELNWEPCHLFEDRVRNTVAWYLENGDWLRVIERKKYQGSRLGLKNSE